MKKIPEHGGNYNFYKNIKYDFSVNINPLKFPEKLKDKIDECFNEIKKYPEIYGETLVNSLADFYNCSKNNILVGNGSIQLIYLIPLALKIKNPLIVLPNFSEYEKSLKLVEANINFYYLKEKNKFELEIDDFINFLKKNCFDSIFITNPSNPVGNLIKYEKIKRIADYCRKNNIFFVVDEAFIDFTEEKSLIDLSYKKLIVLRSFTKIFAIPGLRLGFLKSDSKTVNQIKKYLHPWSLNSFSIEIGKFLIEEKDFLNQTKEFIKKEREFFVRELKRLRYLKIFKGEANYLLLKLVNKTDSFSLSNFLLDNGILIRNCANYRGLNKKFFRVSIKSRKENLILIENLKKFLEIIA